MTVFHRLHTFKLLLYAQLYLTVVVHRAQTASSVTPSRTEGGVRNFPCRIKLPKLSVCWRFVHVTLLSTRYATRPRQF